MNKRITFINQYYWPLNNPPAKRLKEFSEYFAEKNWKVKVITGFPNYPSGKLQKNYKLPLFKKEIYNKVKIYRFLELPLEIKGFIRPLINYLSFTFSSLFSLPLLINSDILFISSPPIFSTISTFILGKIFRKKIVLDIRDLYPETAEELNLIKKSSLNYKIFTKINKWMFKKSDLIISINDLLAKEISNKYNVNVKVIPNFAKKKKTKSHKKEYKKIKIVFTGVITPAQNLKELIKTFRNKEIEKKFEFHIVGSGSNFSEIKRIVESNNLKNIHLYGYKNKEFCDDIISKSDIGIITLKNNELFKKALPSKFFEYISLTKPVIATTSLTLKNLIETKNCGWFSSKNEKEALEKIMLSINKKDIFNKSKNSLILFNDKFEKDLVCKELYSLVNKI